MRTAELGATLLIAQQEGDRPAIITKVFSNSTCEVCGYMPAPEVLKLVIIHRDRREALHASLKDTAYHAYWK